MDQILPPSVVASQCWRTRPSSSDVQVIRCRFCGSVVVVERIALLADTETALIFSTRKATLAFNDELAERIRQ